MEEWLSAIKKILTWPKRIIVGDTSGTIPVVKGLYVVSGRVFNVTTGQIQSTNMDTTGVVAGTYGNSTNSPVLTVDGAGRVTSASTTPMVPSGGQTATYTSATGVIQSLPIVNGLVTTPTLGAITTAQMKIGRAHV